MADLLAHVFAAVLGAVVALPVLLVAVVLLRRPSELEPWGAEGLGGSDGQDGFGGGDREPRDGKPDAGGGVAELPLPSEVDGGVCADAVVAVRDRASGRLAG